MKAKEFIQVLEEVAPLSYQADYDNAGLIVGTPDDEIEKILITLDVTEAVIDEAIEKQANMIISHHPLIFHGIKKFNDNNFVTICLRRAIEHHITIYACHTNLDSVMGGVNSMICKKIGLVNTRILTPNMQNNCVGDGMIGELPEPIDSQLFLRNLKDIFHCESIRYTTICKLQIQKVAVCGGSGSFLIPSAIAAGADIFITADMKYHEFFNAENRIILADIGHYESEQYTKELIYDLLIKKFYRFAYLISEVDTNPIKYL